MKFPHTIIKCIKAWEGFTCLTSIRSYTGHHRDALYTSAMDIKKIRALKAKLSADLAEGSASQGARTQARQLDSGPIYITGSPSLSAAVGRNLDAIPLMDPGSDKKKRWSAIKGVFGSLGKFKKGGKKSLSADNFPALSDATSPAASTPPPVLAGARADDLAEGGACAADAAPADAVKAEENAGPAYTATGPAPAPAPALAPAAPTLATPVSLLAASPLRTMAVEPTPDAALLTLPEPIKEDTLQEESSPRVPSPGPPLLPGLTEIRSPTIVSRVASAIISDVISPTSLSPLRERERTRSPTAWEKNLEDNARELHPTLLVDASKRDISPRGIDSPTNTKRTRALGPTTPESPRKPGWFTSAVSVFPLASSGHDSRSCYTVGQVAAERRFARKVSTQDQLFGKQLGGFMPIFNGQPSKTSQRFQASRYNSLGKDPRARMEQVMSRLATEVEAREINRRRRLASQVIFAELLRLQMEANVCLELDNLHRQRSRIQAIEDEEEERWRRIEENHLHASTPLHLRSDRETSLQGVRDAEAKERSYRISEDGIQSMSGRSKHADDSRKSINAELSKIVWPGVEGWAPAGEQETVLPQRRSRQNPAAVLYFCLSQRNMLHSPKRKLVMLEVLRVPIFQPVARLCRRKL